MDYKFGTMYKDRRCREVNGWTESRYGVYRPTIWSKLWLKNNPKEKERLEKRYKKRSELMDKAKGDIQKMMELSLQT